MAREKTSIVADTLLGGKYRVGRVIGEGGMGQVYEATYEAINRKVAIKHLHHKYANDGEIVSLFHQEALAAGSIGHDNICEVTDVGTQSDGSPYLVMPLLRGVPLSELLAEGRTMPRVRLVDIVSQILSALEAAHAKKIVHRDLKPENIFITKMGDREDFVKLLDFGISKIFDQEAIHQLTKTGVVLGTPHYMAPEQAQGSKKVDYRIDIYAVGVILYQGLTGRLPFNGDNYNELIVHIYSSSFPLPTALNPSIPSKLEQVILKAMARDPRERFGSATEMRQALEEVSVSQEIAQVERATTVKRKARTDEGPAAMRVRRRSTVSRLFVVAGVAIFSAIAVVALLWMSKQETKQSNAPPAIREKHLDASNTRREQRAGRTDSIREENPEMSVGNSAQALVGDKGGTTVSTNKKSKKTAIRNSLSDSQETKQIPAPEARTVIKGRNRSQVLTNYHE